MLKLLLVVAALWAVVAAFQVARDDMTTFMSHHQQRVEQVVTNE